MNSAFSTQKSVPIADLALAIIAAVHCLGATLYVVFFPVPALRKMAQEVPIVVALLFLFVAIELVALTGFGLGKKWGVIFTLVLGCLSSVSALGRLSRPNSVVSAWTIASDSIWIVLTCYCAWRLIKWQDHIRAMPL